MSTVVITGGAQGQGLSHALAFARLGYNVVIGDLFPPEHTLMQAAVQAIGQAGGKCLAVQCDVTRGDQVEALFAQAAEQFETIDVAISNAGIMTFGATWELPEEQVWKTIDINLMGTWRVDKEAAKYMLKQGSGRIINISSTAGLKGTPNLGHYTMSKFGVIGLTKTLAKELSKHGITVNVICPTMVKTPMTDRPEFVDYLNKMNGTSFKTFAEADEALSKKRAMGVAFIEPEDVTRMIVWAATSPEARLITGATLTIDAGSML
ncbi:SDR family NAD(P)-dependent oxidoreductase [Lawsonibacter celer]|uniref:SDR family NAD(P)-dependent oxidoreductase n=1 Tax=Lawsonibacter celer TaxID=2986526 RepID=UPI0016446375|nr:SDR family NAD(P)-dependent oxidoreductase [Lawsonibacter celer]